MLQEAVSYPSDYSKTEERLSMAGRLTPIGGAASDDEYFNQDHEEFSEKTALLQEHENLNASLTALTCHFAHVQLRLQQVISAPTPEDREVKKNSFFQENSLLTFCLTEFTCRIT